MGNHDAGDPVAWQFFSYLGEPTLGLKPWPRPQYPAAWKDKIDSLFTTWAQLPPTNIISQEGNLAIWAFEDAILGPSWTSIGEVTSGTAGLWTSQLNTVKALLAEPSLNGHGYFLFLHLLLSLATGDAASRDLASTIVNAPVSSVEAANDIFINQVVYSSLMLLNDPVDVFGWNNLQLQAFVKDSEDAIVSADTVSTAIRQSLVHYGKLLYSDGSYPMVDPYSPSKGFDQRKADTLAALNKAAPP